MPHDVIESTLVQSASASLPITLIDDEPCIRDEDLGRKLGMGRPRDIRANIIIPHQAELEDHGILRTRTLNAGRRGRPGTEYWLNRDQSLAVCLLSRTDVGRAVRRDVIHAYNEYRASSIPALPPPSAGDKIGAFADLLVSRIKGGVVAPVLSWQKKVLLPPIRLINDGVSEMRSYVDQRFKAMHERDQHHIGLTEDVLDTTNATREAVRELKVFLTRTVPVPVEVEIADFITIAEVQDLVGLPREYRSRSMAGALSASARRWFEERGKGVRVLNVSSGRPRYLFDRQVVPDWWSEEGRQVGLKHAKGKA